ncbi:unnamed protein product [Schistosoma turkestanicum]|nr:unnamed protein product [Schistosoma turkestanicum]
MGKITKLVVCGPIGSGKTSLIEHCIYGNYFERQTDDFISTYEDTYNAVVETDRGSKEKVRIYDLGGMTKLKKHFVSCADAFILVYDVSDSKSFGAVQNIKQDIDKYREKRDLCIVLCCHKVDKPKDTTLDSTEVSRWSQSEKVANTFETTVYDRQSLMNLFTWTVSRVNQSQSKSGFSFGKKDEPAHILIPAQPYFNAPNQNNDNTTSCAIGPCTYILSISANYLISGHMNGWLIIWSTEKYRPVRQWAGHNGYQITSLHFWPRNTTTTGVIISHGRDGFIRFWDLSTLQFDMTKLFKPLDQIFSEIHTYDISFCNSDLWCCNGGNRSTDIYFLAHLCQEEKDNDDNNNNDCSTSNNKEPFIEIIQLPQFVFICQQPIHTIQSTCQNVTNLGMCMTLKGIENTYPTNRIHSLLLAGFESGHLILLGNNGRVLSVLSYPLGQSIPIMTLSIQPVFKQQLCQPSTNPMQITDVKLIALGGPSVDTCDTDTSIDGSIAFVQLEFNAQLPNLFKLSKIHQSLDNNNNNNDLTGISCLQWRDDGRLLAIGQWDGRIRLMNVQLKNNRFKLKSLGYLTSLGSLNEGSLIGEWSSTTLTQPHGPNIDQQSRLIRSCTFTKQFNFLITSVPANVGALGSLLVWDVYR